MLHNIKPIAQLSRAEVTAMAQGAANRDEPLDAANVFEVGTDNHAIFTIEYLAQSALLVGAF